MEDVAGLDGLLARIDGRGYGAYRELRGGWRLDGCELFVDHVQGDPFAAPSRVRVRVAAPDAGFAEELRRGRARAVGTACFLARRFAAAAAELEPAARGGAGSGRSGEISIAAPGQQVIENSAVRVESDGAVEARFRLGLPARGRRVLGRRAAALLLEAVPALVDRSLLAAAHDPAELRLHAETNEDADALRAALADHGLVAFVADGAVLPRRSGVDDRPMRAPTVVPFRSPASLRVRLPAPNAGEVTGMGVPRGVTLVVGGGYHGKSTLLEALARGVYNHRPGDGRERVVADASATQVRAEDGRSVAGVDISAFIGTLPGGVDTRTFSTPDASGSTSQAAAIAEALEAGARTLLVDEDTAATNFMIRDRRMQALVPREREPIVPFVDRVRELHRERGVSTVLVLGGSGDYLDVADTVVAMADFVPSDVTERARAVARELPTGRTPEPGVAPGEPRGRVPDPASIDPSRGRRRAVVRVRSRRAIELGTERIDLSAVSQLVWASQTRALAEALLLARERWMGDGLTVAELLDRADALLRDEGLDALGRGHEGDLALFRRHELAAALNRLRGLRVRPGA